MLVAPGNAARAVHEEIKHSFPDMCSLWCVHCTTAHNRRTENGRYGGLEGRRLFSCIYSHVSGSG